MPLPERRTESNESPEPRGRKANTSSPVEARVPSALPEGPRQGDRVERETGMEPATKVGGPGGEASNQLSSQLVYRILRKGGGLRISVSQPLAGSVFLGLPSPSFGECWRAGCGWRSSWEILLERKPPIGGHENVERRLRETKQIAVLPARPARLRDRDDLVAGELLPEPARQGFVKEYAHARAGPRRPPRALRPLVCA